MGFRIGGQSAKKGNAPGQSMPQLTATETKTIKAVIQHMVGTFCFTQIFGPDIEYAAEC